MLPAVAAPPKVVTPIVVAMAIDAFGSGLFGPFGLLYGNAVVGLPLTQVGIVLSLAGLVGLVAGPIAGAAVDRHGAGRVAVASNLLAVAGAVGLLLASGIVGYAVAALTAFAAARGFWAAFGPLIAAVVEPSRLETWFGRVRAARYVGMTAGAGMAALALMLGEQTGLRLMLGADALSYAVAAVLLIRALRARSTADVPVGAPTGRPASQPGYGSVQVADSAPEAGNPPSYRATVADRANLGLAALNVICTLLATVPLVALPIVTLDHMGQPAWVPGVLAAVVSSSLAVAVLVGPRVTSGRRRLSVLSGAAALWMLACVTLAAAERAGAPLVAFGVLLAGAAALGVAEALHAPTADAVPLALAPPGLEGRYTALHQLAWGISGAVGPALTAFLLDAGTSVLWIVLAALSAATALGYRLARRSAGVRTGRVGGA